MKKLTFALTLIIAGAILLGVSCKPGVPKGTIILSKVEYAPNESIKLNFTTEGKFGKNAWIGLIPSATPHGDESKNDEADVAYQYFEGLTAGEMTFTAPSAPGDYDFRMNSTDDNGVEVTSISFKVVAQKIDVTMVTNKPEYKPGEDIVINFTAPATLPADAWIGLIPSATPHGSEATNDGADVAYEHLSQKTQGTITFKAPAQKGSWDIRMNDSDNDGKEVASMTITVK